MQQSTTVVTIPAQPMNAPFTVAAQPAQKIVFPNFPKKQAVGLGITLIVCGSLSIIFNIVELGVGLNRNYYYYTYWVFGIIGHGFWVGILCIIPGAFGIAAGKYKTKGWLCAFNVMCILAACFAAAQFAIGLTGAIVGPYRACYYNNYYYYYYDCPEQRVAVAMEALMVILGFIEAVAAIWGSSICCRTSCCCSCCVIGGPGQISSVVPTSIPMTYLSGNQQFVVMQTPVPGAQGYTNVGYQPGYPGQPVQFTTLPAGYPPQAQFVPVGQPPPYMVYPAQNVQMMNQPVMGVHAQVDPSAVTVQPGMSAPALQLHEDQTQNPNK